MREKTVQEEHDAQMQSAGKRRRGRPQLPESVRKKRISIMLDPDVIETLKFDGKGWQTRVNQILRRHLDLGCR